MSCLSNWVWTAFLLFIVMMQDASAQTPPDSQLPFDLSSILSQTLDPSDYQIEIDTLATEIGPLFDTDLTGYNTYQLYVTTSNPEDQVSAVYGNTDSPSSLQTSGNFFQANPIGAVTASGVFPEVWPFYPSNQFDSYVTIGIEGPPSAENNEGDILTTQSSINPWTPIFEPDSGSYGSGFELNDLVGGSWFVVSSYSNGIAGPDQRVLIAQLTTNGIISGNLHVQIFRNGNTETPLYLNLTIPVLGCTDISACNYSSDATDDDGFCLQLDECGACGGPGILPGNCDCDGNQVDALGVCGGDCAADADSDGICDDIDDCIGDYDDCGICNGPGAVYDCGCSNIPAGDCDCNGNQLDALGVCGGDCAADADSDGICDDIDDCVGDYDACGICNGPGAIYECECSNIPSGDCDCDGNQLDALGVCGGDCTADADSDGICDDIDDCVGDYDACGICNGPGAIYECGCSGIPAGDCDCDGNQLDALGVCGGDCQTDVDGDGVCDTDEIPGCTDETACNFNPLATDEDGSCLTLDAVGVCGGDCAADVDSDDICDDIDDCVGDYDACGICNGPGAIYECGCTNIPDGDCDCDGNQLDVLGICGGGCTADSDGDGVCDTDEIPGCTDDSAVNFDPTATDENGTCQYAGCTDSSAENYSANAISDDGSCEYLCIGIAGCTYPGATNYQANANCEDGSCEFPPFANDLCIFDLDDNGFIGAADLIVFLGVYEMTCAEINAE